MDPELISNDGFLLNSFTNETLEDYTNDSDEKLLTRTNPNLLAGDNFCKYFCGKDCKYCKPASRFPPDKMVIDGLYSSWVTSNILAMARPSNEYIDKYNIIDQFNKHQIKTIINMQTPGEHSFCGFPLHSPSGLSYDPNKFMMNGIDCLNFPCDDYGAVSVLHLFDIAQIMQHRLTEGKVAVHCHAGHGRTGLVIACYLIFNNRIGGVQAINYVRKKRNGAIQNQLQVDTVLAFAEYIKPLRTIFWTKSLSIPKFSLREAIMRQQKFIHGKEVQILLHIPKILFLCLRRISQPEENQEENIFDSPDSSSESSIALSNPERTNENAIMYKIFSRWNQRIKFCFKKPFPKKYAEKILKYFQQPYADEEILADIKDKLNTSGDMWGKLNEIKDNHLLCQLVLDWFDDLKFPVLRVPDIEGLRMNSDEDLIHVILKLEPWVGKTFILLLEFIEQFQSLSVSNYWDLYSIIFSRLTQKNVIFLQHFDTKKYFPFELKSDLINILQELISKRMEQCK